MKVDNKKFEIAMANACFTAENLSKATGIAQVTIARIKKGIQNPRPVTVGKIAKALDCKVQDLIEEGAATPTLKSNY